MDRRSFMARAGAAAAATFTAEMTLSERAEAFEGVMIDGLPRQVTLPVLCEPDRERSMLAPGSNPSGGGVPDLKLVAGMPDPRLPSMPERPTLLDFYRYRIPNPSHMLQSANLAMKNGMDEKVILACLLHDISVSGLIRTDHGFWGAQLVAPYVDEEVSWAIQKHQALRFFADESVGYEYPEAYRRWFGEDHQVESWIQAEYEEARNHRWYMNARLITVNDLYSFDPTVTDVTIEQFEDVVGRQFKQPREGLGFDGSPVAHMWRTMIWPNSWL
jgi:hypothetical protein